MNHIVDRRIDILRWDSNHSIALTFQPVGFAFIPLLFVTFSVHLHHETLRYAEEVDEVRASGHLTTELVTVDLPVSQPRPDTPLGLGHVVAEVSSSMGFGRGHEQRIE